MPNEPTSHELSMRPGPWREFCRLVVLLLRSRVVRVALLTLLVAEVFTRLDRVPLWYLYHRGGSPAEVYWRMMLYRASLVWLVCLVLARSRWLRWPAVMLAAAAVAMDQFYLRYINGDGMTPHEMFLAWANPGTAGESITMYWDLAWPAVGASFLLVVALAVAARRWVVAVPTRVAGAVSLLVVPLMVMMALEGYGPGGHVVMPIRLPAFMAYYGTHPMIPDREPCYFQPAAEPRADHIIVIMDESVMGSHLEVNGYVRATSPGLSELIDRGDAVSLGTSSASCNYSVGSFLVMLSGTTEDGMRAECERPPRGGQETHDEQFLHRPSMYAYAAQAGYEMHFVNSQDYLVWVAHDKRMLGPRLHTVTADRKRLPRWQADHALIDDIVDFVADRARTFTVVAKRGIHYPYFDKCPPGRRPYRPCLEKATWSDSFIENVNAYDNGMWWACDEYLRRLHEGLARTGKNVLVIYTSDHGQVLPGEPMAGYTFKRTHAMVGSPSSAVADVPLVLLATGDAYDHLAALPRENAGATSHFDIFPSVLWLMGYDTVDIEPEYGPDLWRPHGGPRRRVFFEGSNPVERWQEFVPPDYGAKFRLIREQDALTRRKNEEGRTKK